MPNVYFVICAVILFATGDSRAITEAQLVGTWEASAPDMINIHGTSTITYRPDHTCTHKDYGEYASTAHGTWRLHGRQLMTRFGKELVVRSIVLSVTADQFKTRGQDGTVFTYTRVKAER